MTAYSAESGVQEDLDQTQGLSEQRKMLRPLVTLLPYMLRYKGLVMCALLALIMAAAATLTVPLMVRQMIDIGFSSANLARINQYFGLMMGLALLLACASASRYYFVMLIGERVINDVRIAVFAHVLHLPTSFFDSTRSGEILSRLTADMTQIKSAVGAGASIALRNVVLLIGAVLMMIITSPKLSALAMLAIPLVVGPLIWGGRKVRGRTRIAMDKLAEAIADANEAIGEVRLVQAFGNQKLISDGFSHAVETAFLAERSRIRTRAFLTSTAIMLVFMSVLAILWYGAQDVISGVMSAGVLGQFVLYAVLAAAATGELSEVWGEAQQAAGAAERISELLAEPPSRTARNPVSALPEPVSGRLRFERVSFRYPGVDREQVLREVSFTAEQGQTVALVGPSGAGKSSLFRVIMRAYELESGAISLDGVDIAHVMLPELRAHISYVPQEPVMFSASICQNIGFGRPSASFDEICAAAKAAHADEFIRALPAGYDTRVGERGMLLSGGQRQRIAIARAILRDAPLLLLDEATSALDAESEQAIQEAIKALKAGRTTLVIAHRLASVRDADMILVMNQGRLVEKGTHVELRQHGGLYARLAELQFGEFGEG